MASNVEVNLIARTSDFEDKMTKATKTFEALAFKGADSNKALSKSFEQLNKIASSELSDLQKAFNALQVKGDFGIGIQKDKIAEAKRFYIQQFNEIKNSAETSAAETARAWAGLKNAFSNINKANGLGSSGSSEFKILMQAQQEANAMNDKFNDMRLRADAKTYEEALALNQKFNYDKAKSELRMLEEANLLNSKFNYDRLQSQIKMQEEANLLNQKFNHDKLRSEAAMLQEARILNQKFDYERMQSAAKLAAAKVLADQEALVKINIAHEQALRMDKERDAQMALSREAALRKMTLAHVEANAMNAKFNAGLNQTPAAVEKVGHGINGWSLASVAAIAKIQIMYSLINNVMSAIGSAPGKAVDVIENYKTSIITNAALITSMAGGTKNIGEEYKKNKVYAEAVEKVLVRMDTETSASYEQLQIMNRAYMQQGVYLDINNQKAIEGRRNTANALAVIAQATPNPNMQFGQEIRGLMNGTMKEGNALLKMLVGIDKDVVEKIERWKKAGTLDENIGKLLQGFAAAQGDIDNMWATVKSTMATIRDEVLRGGLAPAFGEIVELMKDMNKWAGENKEKFQSWLKDGFADAKVVATYMFNLGKAVSYFSTPIVVGAVALGFAAVAKGISAINIALLATPIGRISAIIGLATTAVGWGIGKYGESLDNNQAARDVRDQAVGGKGVGSVELAKQREYMAQFNAGAFEQVKAKFPMMNNETIGMLLKNKGIELQSEVVGVYGELATTVIFNELKIKKLLEAPKVATPKPGKGGKDVKSTVHEANPLIATWNSLLLKDKTGVSELEDKLYKNAFTFQKFLDDFKKSDEKKYLATQGITESTIKAKKLEFDNQIRNLDWENRMVKLAQDGENQILSDKAVFALKNADLELKTNRYKVTSLSKYGLNTAYYGIKQQAPANAQDKYNVNRMKEEFANAQAQQSAWGGDNYGSKFGNMTASFEIEKANLQGQYDEKLLLKEEFDRKMLATEQKYSAEKNSLGLSMMSDSIGIMKQAFAGNKAMMITAMILEKSIAIARIMMNTEVAASAAIAAAAMIPVGGVAIGQANAAAIRAMSYASIGMVLASGAIEGMQIAGGREFGGPVTAGKSYIVGEKRPELFTPGASGTITPYVPSSGQGVTINQSFNITGVGAEIMSNVKTVAKQAADAAKAEILNSMNRGSEFALASGRMK